MRKGFSFTSGLALALSATLCRPALAEDRVSTAIAAPGPDAAFTLPASLRAFAAASASSWLAVPVAASARQPDSWSDVSSSATEAVPAVNGLPEAPEPTAHVTATAPFGTQASGATGTAPHYALTVPSGWSAQPLSGGDKAVIGLRNLVSPVNFAGILISAGYAHLVDGQPNFGVDGTAFAKRFGAGVARSSSQDIFSISILSPLLREDPRYYIQGPQRSFKHRVIYAATRPLIGRTDSGHSTVNASLLIGYAGAAALTRLYYPQSNRNFHDVASTFGSSLGGAAIGFGFTEFSDQLFKAIHLRK